MAEETDRSLSAERLVVFTDAVIAIVITLLALPLVDIATELAGDKETALPSLGALLDAHKFQLLGFTISFLVISRLWWSHHRIFGHVVRWSTPLVVLNVLWLFSIVLLPVATAYQPDAHPEVIALYIGVTVVCNLLLTSLAWLVHRRPDLTDGADADSLRRVIASAETSFGFLLALVIGTTFPVVNYFAFFVLAFTGRLERVIERRILRRRERPRR